MDTDVSRPAHSYYEFGPFRLVPREGQLWRGAEEVPLTQKSFKVLLLLLENGGHVLDKAELVEKVWPDAYVEENRLADNISTLRKALGDDPKAPRYIKTVPGRGYRFIADVREVHENGPGVLVAERARTHIVVEEEVDEGAAVGPSPARASGATRAPVLPAARVARPAGRAVTAAVAACVLVAASAAVYYFGLARKGDSQEPQRLRSLAVLPFRPLGAGADDEHLGLGMTDALITRLSNVRQVVVRPTSAVMKYAEGEPDPLAVAREQQVEALLDGRIQRVGDRVRLTVQLLRAADGAPLWAETFDERSADIFALQDSVSRKVAAALRPQLSSEESAHLTKRYTENAEAYRLYQLGRYFWNRRTPEGFEKALGYYQRAVAADPDFALAHAGLAETYVLLPSWTTASPDESYAKAERAARRALELDPQLAEAYAALGAVKDHHGRDWAGAGEDYRRAIELNPNYATGHQWYGEWLGTAGRVEEAVAEGAAALRIDPLSPIVNLTYGTLLNSAGRTEEGEAQIRRALELEPALYRAHVFLSRIYFDRGLYEQSIRERALLTARGDGAEAARREAALLTAYRSGGREGYARALLKLRDDPALTPEHRIGNWVEGCSMLRDKDCAFEALREAERVNHPLLGAIKTDPYFAFLRPDPRYAELLRRLGLPQ